MYKYSTQTVTYLKWAIFDILMATALAANLITRQWTHFSHFFSLLFELYLLVFFIFEFQDLQNLVPWGPCYTLRFGLWYTHLLTKDKTLKPVNKISLFCITFSNFWYITCSVPNLTPIWFQSRGLFMLFLINILLNL